MLEPHASWPTAIKCTEYRRLAGPPEPGRMAIVTCEEVFVLLVWPFKHAIKFRQASSFPNLSMHWLGICLRKPTGEKQIMSVTLQGVAWASDVMQCPFKRDTPVHIR
eukprot:scaffold394233_cov18-Prasinocladus_malaysianus.AAC.1